VKLTDKWARQHELKNFLSGGQFGPARGGQFQPAQPGQFKSARGGQFHRRLQFMEKLKKTS